MHRFKQSNRLTQLMGISSFESGPIPKSGHKRKTIKRIRRHSEFGSRTIVILKGSRRILKCCMCVKIDVYAVNGEIVYIHISMYVYNFTIRLNCIRQVH